MPDFLEAVCDLTFNRAGCLGYAYLTGQPWDMGGSYGFRKAGVVAFDAEVAAWFEYWDTRAHDERPRYPFTWAADVMLLVMPDGDGETELETLRREAAELEHDWDRGPLGGQPPREDDGAHARIPACARFELSPDGAVAGVLLQSGELIALDTRTGARADLGPAEAFELGAPGSIRWAIEGEARRRALAELAWVDARDY